MAADDARSFTEFMHSMHTAHQDLQPYVQERGWRGGRVHSPFLYHAEDK